MSQPDEALLWARKNSVTRTHALAKAYRAGAAASEARIKALEEGIRSADRRIKDYSDLTVEQWGESVADGGITAWMVIREELRTVVAGDLRRALLKEPDQ